MKKCDPTMAIGAAMIIAAGVGAGCSEDDNGSGEGDDRRGEDDNGPGEDDSQHGGSSSFSVRGAVEEDFSGYAEYDDNWDRDMRRWNEFSLKLTDFESFTLGLTIRTEEPSLPAEGTYEVYRHRGEMRFGADFATFEEWPHQGQTSYAPPDDPEDRTSAGTVEVTSSSPSSVEGTFEFQAVHQPLQEGAEEDDPAEITITNGEFQAVPR